MSTSDSDLSTPPATDDEMPVDLAPQSATKGSKKKKNGLIVNYFAKKDRSPSPPPRKKRAPSPPHEPVPEDNPDIAFIVMFRSRFSEAFPAKCPHLGPQDVERGVAGDLPSSEIEALLCALLGLVNNRKKPVEKGQYGRALEEAVQTQKHQWPTSWNHVNPLHGGRSFNTMSPTERLGLLKALVEWSLNHSEAIKAIIKDAYKSRSTKDKLDANIPLSVQVWGKDGDKRRYWLVQGQDDTPFRVYRESNPVLKHVHWRSVAGSIEDLQALSTKLRDEDGHRDAKALSERINYAIPMFEATEEKRKKRAYRQERKNKLERPLFYTGLYEGRTRGKRTRYTYDEAGDDDLLDDDDSETGVRRSTRTSGRESSGAPPGAAGGGPTVTSSGRHVRSRATGLYGESLLSGQTTEQASPATGEYVRSEASEEAADRPAHGRATRAAGRGGALAQGSSKRAFESYKEDGSDEEDEEDATSWNGDDEEDDEGDDGAMDVDDEEDDEDDLENGDPEEEEDDAEPQHLIVRLKIGKDSFDALDEGGQGHQGRKADVDVDMQDSYARLPASVPTTTTTASAADADVPLAVSIPVSNGAPPPAGMDAARQHPVLASAPAPPAVTALPAPPLPPPTAAEGLQVPGLALPQHHVGAPPAVLPPVQQGNGIVVSGQGTGFRAPTPPYTGEGDDGNDEEKEKEKDKMEVEGLKAEGYLVGQVVGGTMGV